MNNIISINPSIKLTFYQAHRHLQLEITLRRKPNVLHYCTPVNITEGSKNLLMIKESNIIVQNIITAFNCQDKIPLDDKYVNHHT